MMDELKDVKRALNPTEVLLVVDAMTGQEAAGVCIFPFTCLTLSTVIVLYIIDAVNFLLHSLKC